MCTSGNRQLGGERGARGAAHQSGEGRLQGSSVLGLAADSISEFVEALLSNLVYSCCQGFIESEAGGGYRSVWRLFRGGHNHDVGSKFHRWPWKLNTLES